MEIQALGKKNCDKVCFGSQESNHYFCLTEYSKKSGMAILVP